MGRRPFPFCVSFLSLGLLTLPLASLASLSALRALLNFILSCALCSRFFLTLELASGDSVWNDTTMVSEQQVGTATCMPTRSFGEGAESQYVMVFCFVPSRCVCLCVKRKKKLPDANKTRQNDMLSHVFFGRAPFERADDGNTHR